MASELRYPTQIRIDFGDPEVQRAIYDLFDFLEWVPDIDRLCRVIPILVAKGLEMDETIADKDLTISERSEEANELERRNKELIEELNGVQIKLEEIDGEDLLSLKEETKRLQKDLGFLQREAASLRALNKELDW